MTSRNTDTSDIDDEQMTDVGAPERSGANIELPSEHDEKPQDGAPEVVEAELAPPSKEELEAADRRVRRARRKRLILWGTPVVVILALVAFKLLSMIFIANQAVKQYEAGSYEESLNTSELLTYGNVIEPWKAHYDVGTNYLQLGVLPESKAELEQALALAAPSEACPVRANLAITIERLGDLALANGDEAASKAYYEEAKKVLAERDPSCEQSSSEPSSQETEQRLEQKTGEGNEGSQDSTSSPTPSPSESPTPNPSNTPDEQSQENETPGASASPQSAEEQLQEQLGENQQQREEQLDEENNSSSGGAEKPW